MLELRLRHWLRDVMGEDCLQWVEPGRGSSVGVGDAILSLPRNNKLPVELKIWNEKSKGLCCDMRPAQIRYHYMTWYRKKGKTAIIFVVDRDVYVLAGQYVPKDQYKHEVADRCVRICSIDEKIEKAILYRAIVRAFNKEST